LSATVELPLWLVIGSISLATLWLMQHFLLPTARWIVRRRANRVIDEVNTRLALKIPSFKLTRREVLIDRLCFHPQVLELVAETSQQEQIPREALMRQVQVYAREIVPAFNALLYFKTAYWLARRILHWIYRIRLGFADDDALASLNENSSVVFLMNHRSNMDYVVATYLAAERTALSYAVGEWARVWPLQQLIRLMGGYFVRRDSGDPLYRRVLQCYVQMAAEGGVPQAVFPEGRLSRDGRLSAAKLGLLGYIVRGFDPAAERDIVFIPVGINYDRVFEDRSLLRHADGLPRRGKIATTLTLLGFIGRNLLQSIRGTRYRYGYACVNFGLPVSLKQWLQDNAVDATEPLQDVSALAEDLMQRIGAITPILPVALVTSVFARDPQRRLSELALKAEVNTLLQALKEKGHRAYIPRADRDYAVTVGVRMLTLRRILLEDDGYLRVNPAEHGLLAYYANSIAHLLPDKAPDRVKITL